MAWEDLFIQKFMIFQLLFLVNINKKKKVYKKLKKNILMVSKVSINILNIFMIIVNKNKNECIF